MTRAEPGGPLLISPVVGRTAATARSGRSGSSGRRGHGLAYVHRAEAEQTATRRAGDSGWPGCCGRFLRRCSSWCWPAATEGTAAEQKPFPRAVLSAAAHAATLISSDGSVSLPAISPPTLVLGCRLRRRARAGREVGVGLPGRRLAAAGAGSRYGLLPGAPAGESGGSGRCRLALSEAVYRDMTRSGPSWLTSGCRRRTEAGPADRHGHHEVQH